MRTSKSIRSLSEIGFRFGIGLQFVAGRRDPKFERAGFPTCLAGLIQKMRYKAWCSMVQYVFFEKPFHATFVATILIASVVVFREPICFQTCSLRIL